MLCPTFAFGHELGEYRYEITNHLGNVNAVITDNKEWNSTNSYYEAEIITSADYYPFGMPMPGGRSHNIDQYRYGYNGMELDNDVKGNGNSYTTEFRQYDPRLGRWLSLDPLMNQFPWMSPYVAFNDNPVMYVDPLGLEPGNGDPEGAPSNPSENDLYVNQTSGRAYRWTQVEEGKFGWVDSPSEDVGVTVKVTKNPSVQYDKWIKSIGMEGMHQFTQELYLKKLELQDNGIAKGLYGTDDFGHARLPQEVKDRAMREAEAETVPALKAAWAARAAGYNGNVMNSMNPLRYWAYMYWRGRTTRTNDEAFNLLTEVAIECALAWADRFISFKLGAGPSGSTFGKPLRAAYRNEVKGLQEVVDNMTTAGKTSEEIARKVHQMRRDIGVKYKNLTPESTLQKIRARNKEKYGDELGPTIEWLRGHGKSWDDIIESATRTGGKDLGF